MDLPTLLSAGAATVAAVLAGLNLIVSRRREHAQWAREALADAFAAYMDASFECGLACREATVVRARGADAHQLDDLRARLDDSHDTQLRTLTRLRLLSTRGVAASAQALHTVEHDLVRPCFDGTDVPDRAAVADVRERLRRAREVMIGAARLSMRLRGESDPDGTSGLPVRALCPDPMGFDPDVDP
jgi:hypothetical protein